MKSLLTHIFISACLLAPNFTQISETYGGARKLGGNHMVEFSIAKDPAACPYHKSKQDA